MKKILLLFCLMLVTISGFAQRQFLKTVSFYKAYLDVPIVKKAVLMNGTISQDMIEYILNAQNPCDVKYALVNAWGAQNINQNAIAPYIEMFSNRYNNEMSAATEMACIYLNILLKADESYVDLEPFINQVSNFENVNQMDEKSRATSIIYSLIYAQYIFNVNYVGGMMPMSEEELNGEAGQAYAVMWRTINEGFKPLKTALQNTPSGFKNDIRPKAIDFIMDEVKDFVK